MAGSTRGVTQAPLAHSAPSADREPHLYCDHIRGAVRGARENAEAVAAYLPDPLKARFVAAVVDGTTFHDLGKLDPDNQAALRSGRAARMPWDHVDAGVAHLMRNGARAAAWIARAHHAPGLPNYAEEFNKFDPEAARGLRGGRIGERDREAGLSLKGRTDRLLDDLVAEHSAAVGTHATSPGGAKHGLFMRLALSCLVDGDHADAAQFETGRSRNVPVAERWEERLAALDAYVAQLPKGGPRQTSRDAFYDACRRGSIEHAMVACEGPVGIGKTTSVAAWCLRRAIASGARRVFIVAPFTTILSQTAETLRRALTLADEAQSGAEVVAEHHHRADFAAIELRDLAVLWRAPIILTTAVQFFETLAACDPALLRKLHGLPGSVVFIDEAHAALPAPLWRQNWAWMRELASDWGCSFVFASGSLARVWTEPDIVGADGVATIPEISGVELAKDLDKREHDRVRFETLGLIADPVSALLSREGPRLAVFNTVQTAAVIAERLRRQGADVLHLSTALCPADRDPILTEIKRRLRDPNYPHDWTLVATSLVEAGVDLSFRSAFRERFSAASLIQIGGRANRHGLHSEPGSVVDFLLAADADLTAHPAAARPSAVLGDLFQAGAFSGVFSAGDLVTRALRAELRREHGSTGSELADAEAALNYPAAAEAGRLIANDTELVIVRCEIADRIRNGERISSRDLLSGSVQLWRSRIAAFDLSPIGSRAGIFEWPRAYDGKFLGYMAGVISSGQRDQFII